MIPVSANPLAAKEAPADISKVFKRLNSENIPKPKK